MLVVEADNMLQLVVVHKMLEVVGCSLVVEVYRLVVVATGHNMVPKN